ncbi:MAG: hypothetical protein FWF31_12325 [Desulfobulbus sp.]|nr:hypothetical protein [Desulfobulbus sp.]
MIRDFFDRTFEAAQEKTVGLPFILLICDGNDGRGAIAQIERIGAGYKWLKMLEHVRVVGTPTEQDYLAVAGLGQTLAAGLHLGFFLSCEQCPGGFTDSRRLDAARAQPWFSFSVCKSRPSRRRIFFGHVP